MPARARAALPVQVRAEASTFRAVPGQAEPEPRVAAAACPLRLAAAALAEQSVGSVESVECLTAESVE